MGSIRRTYSRPYKLEAVGLIVRGRSAADVARDLGLPVKLLRHWKSQLARYGDRAFPGMGRCRPEAAELERLRREVTQLREERDILKKAQQVFRRVPL